MIALVEHASGTILPVKARAGARANEIRGEHDGSLLVAVTAAPEKGKANQAIIKLLADRLSLRKSDLELIAGETSPRKQFLVRGIQTKELRTRLESVMDSLE